MADGRFAGERWNRLQDQIMERALQKKEMVKREMMQSGFPPGGRKLTDAEQYQQLATWRLMGDPRFTPQAAQALQRLEMRFGPAPAPPPPQPFA